MKEVLEGVGALVLVGGAFLLLDYFDVLSERMKRRRRRRSPK